MTDTDGKLEGASRRELFTVSAQLADDEERQVFEALLRANGYHIKHGSEESEVDIGVFSRD